MPDLITVVFPTPAGKGGLECRWNDKVTQLEKHGFIHREGIIHREAQMRSKSRCLTWFAKKQQRVGNTENVSDHVKVSCDGSPHPTGQSHHHAFPIADT
jgi:hypothetical protein